LGGTRFGGDVNALFSCYDKGKTELPSPLVVVNDDIDASDRKIELQFEGRK